MKMKERGFTLVVICDEIINGQMSHCYTIRDENDCSPVRFHKVATFDTYDDARKYLDFLAKAREFYKQNNWLYYGDNIC